MKSQDTTHRPEPELETDPALAPAYLPEPISTQREQVRTVLLAVVVGLLSGLAVVWIRLAIASLHLLLQGSWTSGREHLLWLAPALGGLIAAVIVLPAFPYVRSSGVNAISTSLHLNHGYVSLRTTIGNFLASALAIGSGHALGPEDPSSHIGVGFASFLGRRMRLRREQLARLAPVGAAAGLAGALNAPIAAVLFVAEVVIGSWTAGMLAPVVIGAIASVMVVRYFLGTQPWGYLPAVVIGGPRELLGYIVIGLVGGLVSALFIRSVAVVRSRLRTMPRSTYCFQVAAAGLVTGAIAYLGFPQVMGPGYSFLSQSMSGQFGWKLLGAILLLKIVAATLSFAARTPGGIIAPTLFIGASLGCAVSGLEHSLTTHATASASAFALIGMSVLFAGVLRAPISAVVLVTELSGSYAIMLPAIVATAVASVLARKLQQHSLFEIIRTQDGVCLPAIEEETPQPALQVQDAMQAPNYPVVDSSLTLRQAWREASDKPGDLIFVRRNGAGWTTMDREILDRLEASSDREQRLENVIDNPPIPHLYPDLPLDSTLGDLQRWPLLPVVSRANARSLAGVVTMADAMARYRRESHAMAANDVPDTVSAAMRA
ncbi:MAG: chloride channel protein [Terriglobales bacterium]